MRAAHHDQFGHAGGEPRVERQRRRQVRQRCDGHQRDRVGGGPKGLDQEFDRSGACRAPAAGRHGQGGAVDAPSEVVLRPGPRRVEPRQRAAEALVDGHVAAAHMVEHAQGVVGAVLHGDIAADCRAGDQIEAGMQRRQHDRHRVVGPGVHVQDQFAPHALPPPDGAPACRPGARARKPEAMARAVVLSALAHGLIIVGVQLGAAWPAERPAGPAIAAMVFEAAQPHAPTPSSAQHQRSRPRPFPKRRSQAGPRLRTRQPELSRATAMCLGL